ncbi:hypothetical protein DFH27DRAFT_608548 [Peziza echinospora]|nr:hypothetical protein DFH27DRAFT_608548 [Peziza echinospora]
MQLRGLQITNIIPEGSSAPDPSSALIHEQQQKQLRKAHKPILVNKKALSITCMMNYEHERHQKAKLAADAQIAADMGARKAAREAAKVAADCEHGGCASGSRGSRDSYGGRGGRGGGRRGAKSTSEALN